MKAKRENRGGARRGAGRKPLADKKKGLTIYPLESQIEICGGKDSAKEIALKSVVLTSQQNQIPLWQQAEEWLWEKHKIYFSPKYRGGAWYVEYWNTDETECLFETEYFDSPITAKQEGIKQAIKYLKFQANATNNV